MNQMVVYQFVPQAANQPGGQLTTDVQVSWFADFVKLNLKVE